MRMANVRAEKQRRNVACSPRTAGRRLACMSEVRRRLVIRRLFEKKKSMKIPRFSNCASRMAKDICAKVRTHLKIKQ